MVEEVTFKCMLIKRRGLIGRAKMLTQREKLEVNLSVNKGGKNGVYVCANGCESV